MNDAIISVSFGSSLTLLLLTVALGIFGWLTAKSRKVSGFQFQISLFIVIWIVGEIVNSLEEGGVIRLFSTSGISMYIHLLAMATFSAMLWTRFYMSQKSGKKMADSLQEG
jgi:hypothetical protein